jgi:hypothetical protein
VRIHLLLLLSAACGQPPIDPIDPPDPPPDEPRFTAEEGPAPALRLEGRFEDGLTVEVRAEGLGPVFGLAGQLAFDPSHLAVKSAELAPGLLSDSAELLRADPSAVVFGVARKGPALGDAALEGDVHLATVRFSVLRAGDSKLAVSRAMVRRSDGAFVAAAFLGAEVHTGGTP